MTPAHSPRLLIAEDETLLRDQLREGLLALWPEARICAEAADGNDALAAIHEHRPDVAFLDIRMPHLSGLEVARRTTGASRIVFVTAYNRHAVDAFERGAVDYLLKPISMPRLSQTVARLQALLSTAPANMQALFNQMAKTLRTDDAVRHLEWVRASRGNTVQMISADEVHYFQADERYTRVVTAEGESFIKTGIRELAEQLDPGRFWQIHRATLVNVKCVASITRRLAGGAELQLKGRPERLAVSRAYTHLFRQM